MKHVILCFALLVPLFSWSYTSKIPNCYNARGYIYGSFGIKLDPHFTSYRQQLLAQKFLYLGFEIQYQNLENRSLIVRRYAQLDRLSDFQMRSTFAAFKNLIELGEIKSLHCVRNLP